MYMCMFMFITYMRMYIHKLIHVEACPNMHVFLHPFVRRIFIFTFIFYLQKYYIWIYVYMYIYIYIELHPPDVPTYLVSLWWRQEIQEKGRYKEGGTIDIHIYICMYIYIYNLN